MQSLSENIKAIREHLSMTQVEMSAALQLKRTTYANYENGAAEPNVTILVKLAHMADITLEEVLTTNIRETFVARSPITINTTSPSSHCEQSKNTALLQIIESQQKTIATLEKMVGMLEREVEEVRKCGNVKI